MAVITLKIVVSSLSEVLKVFDRIKVHRSTTGQAGPYIEVTNPSTRLLLETGKVLYQYQDETGAADYYYRVTYFNSLSLLESSMSEPQQGEQDAALSVISVEELKTNYLWGVDLTGPDGTPYPDSLFEFYIKAAVSYVERYLDINIRPTEYDEFYDYDPNAWNSFMMVQANHYPIISVEEMALRTLTAQDAFLFQKEWLRIHKETGQINVVPTGPFGVTWFGLHQGFSPRFGAKFIPDAIRIKYTAGFENGKVPDGIRNAIGTLSAYGPLNIAGDLVGGAGLAAASLSIDGLSQSITTSNSSTNAGYGARLLEYAKHIKMYLPELRRSYKGIRIAVG